MCGLVARKVNGGKVGADSSMKAMADDYKNNERLNGCVNKLVCDLLILKPDLVEPRASCCSFIL